MNDAHKVAQDLAYAAKVFDSSGGSLLDAVGQELKPDVGDAVRADIGDQSMSGWRRGKPVTIDGRYDVKGDLLVVTPQRMAAGPMRVLESGRSAYAAGDTRRTGTRTRKRTGEKVATTRRVGRAVGATRGKGTWGDAEQLLEQDAPAAVERAVLRVAAKARLI